MLGGRGPGYANLFDHEQALLEDQPFFDDRHDQCVTFLTRLGSFGYRTIYRDAFDSQIASLDAVFDEDSPLLDARRDPELIGNDVVLGHVHLLFE